MSKYRHNKSRKIRRRVGDRVELTRRKAIKHRKAGELAITGTIVAIDEQHFEGIQWRPVQIQFDDNYPPSWWASWEVRKIS